MANISSLLQKIQTAIYGEEVRGAIYDALAAMNVESSNAMQFASTAKDSAQASASEAKTSAATATQNATAASVSAQAVEAVKNTAEAAAKDAQNSKAAAEAAKISAEAASKVAGSSEDAANKSAKDAAANALSAKQYSGKPPKPLNGTWWIWDAENQTYEDTRIGCELAGPIGVGIADIKLTSGNHMPGTTDAYTVELTDGTTYGISVYNGRNGIGTGDVLGIWFDLVIPAAGWQNGEITIADSRLLALSTHKYFLSADQASREEFLECNVQPRDITTTGFITFTNDTDPAEDIIVTIIRFELSANGTT